MLNWNNKDYSWNDFEKLSLEWFDELISAKPGEKVLLISDEKFDKMQFIIACLYKNIIGSLLSTEDLDRIKLNNLQNIFNKLIISKKIKQPQKKKPAKITKKYYTIVGDTSEKQMSWGWMFFTSGTRGVKKLVCVDKTTMNWRVENDRNIFKLNRDSNSLCCLSLNHELGFYQFLASYGYVKKLFVMNIISAFHLLTEMNKNEITHYVATPRTWIQIEKENLAEKMKKYLDQTKIMTISGGEITECLQQKILKFKPEELTIIKTYGQTETSRSLWTVLEKNTVGVTGKAVEGVQVTIGEDNELYHSGAGMMNAFYRVNEGELIKASKTIRTGDRFIKIGENYKFCGRADDIVKINDLRFSLVTLQNHLVDELKVNFICDYYKNKLFIIYQDDVEIDEVKIKNILPSQITEFEVICENFEFNSNGKINREKLREKYVDR